MLLFNSLSTVKYNNVVIDNIVSSRVSMEPIYNERGTTIKYTRFTIELEAIVHPESFQVNAGQTNTNEALERIRTALLEERRVFELSLIHI